MIKHNAETNEINFAGSLLALVLTSVFRADQAIECNEMVVADMYLQAAEKLMDSAHNILMYDLGVELELPAKGGKCVFEYDAMAERLRVIDDRLWDMAELLEGSVESHYKTIKKDNG